LKRELGGVTRFLCARKVGLLVQPDPIAAPLKRGVSGLDILENPVTRLALSGGVTGVFRRIFDLGVQVYSVPVDATLFRLMGGIRVR